MSRARILADYVSSGDELADKLSLSGGAMTGAITTNSTFDGVDVGVRDGILTSTTTTAAAALPTTTAASTYAPKASPIFTGVTTAASLVLTPGSAPATTEGAIYYDSATDAVKIRASTAWEQLSNKFTASGGTETTYSSGGINYKVHTFTTSSFFIPVTAGSIDVLIVAGGGGGEQKNSSGGAGGGGVLHYTHMAVSAQSYTIEIGDGGAGGVGFAGAAATNGENTIAFGSTAYGGGVGGHRDSGTAPTAGGSSGGCGGPSGNSNQTSPAATQTDRTAQGGIWYGNIGGTSAAAQNYEASGGGGAGAVGLNGVYATTAGAGGAGIQINIDGNNYYWAGGGGGCGYDEPNGNGGIGGGGGGANHFAGSYQTNGTGGGSAINSGTAGNWSSTSSDCYGGSGGANSGGGGGGSYYNSATGGTGGSGIVIVRYVV